MKEGKAYRGAACAAPLALALALSLAAPSAALAADSANTSSADVTVVAAGFWPAQETSSVDVSRENPPAGHFSKTSDAMAGCAMAALAGVAASSFALLACVSRRED